MFTFSDSRIEWFSQRITVVNWTYIADSSITGPENPKDPFSVGCKPLTTQPSTYSSAQKMNYFDGYCGFKYQVSNADENTSYKFQVLRDGATALVSSAAALALLLTTSF